MRSLGLAVVLISGTLSAGAQPAQAVDPALRAAVAARDAAIAAIDTRSFAAFSPADAVFVMSSGAVHNTPQRVEDVSARKPRGPQPTLSDDHLRVFETTAVRTYTFAGRTQQGDPIVQRIMEVWSKQRDGWKVVGAQFTRITP